MDLNTLNSVYLDNDGKGEARAESIYNTGLNREDGADALVIHNKLSVIIKK